MKPVCYMPTIFMYSRRKYKVNLPHRGLRSGWRSCLSVSCPGDGNPSSQASYGECEQIKWRTKEQVFDQNRGLYCNVCLLSPQIAGSEAENLRNFFRETWHQQLLTAFVLMTASSLCLPCFSDALIKAKPTHFLRVRFPSRKRRGGRRRNTALFIYFLNSHVFHLLKKQEKQLVRSSQVTSKSSWDKK